MKNILLVLIILSGNCLNAQIWTDSLRKAQTLHKEQKYSQALDLYKRAKDNSANDKYLESELAQSAYRLGDYESSCSSLELAIINETSPNELSRLYYNLGNVFFKKGNYKEAIDNYKLSLRKNPENQDAKYNLSQVLRKKKNKLQNGKDSFNGKENRREGLSENKKQLNEKIDNIKEELKKLSNKQKELANQKEKNLDEQKQIKKDFNELKEEINKLKKINEELQNPMTLEDTKKEQESIDAEIKKAQEQIEKNEPRKSTESQNKAANKLDELVEKLNEIQNRSTLEKELPQNEDRESDSDLNKKGKEFSLEKQAADRKLDELLKNAQETKRRLSNNSSQRKSKNEKDW